MDFNWKLISYNIVRAKSVNEMKKKKSLKNIQCHVKNIISVISILQLKSSM